MTRRTPRQGGWLWPAVLTASAVLVLVAGKQVVAPPTVAADVPVVTRVEPVVPTPTPTATARARSTARSSWTTRSAAPRKAVPAVPPERLLARSVGLDLPVVPTGVAKGGQMALPEKPSELGWYAFGSSPADRRGAVVVAGHVDSDRYGAGPLKRLAGLDRGDRVELRDGGGRTTTYEVVTVQRIRKTDFGAADVFDRSGPAVLHIVTCGGAYDTGRGGYQDNLVVTAVPR